MDQSLCKLTLVAPAKGSDRIVELILAAEPPVGGFTSWPAEGHGHGFEKASVAERVRGRVKRTVLVAVLPRARAADLLETIMIPTAIPHLSYWIEPVESFGQIGLPEEASAFQPDPAEMSAP
ncbi:DUF3240 family protein [Hyphomicrobium sp.]|uniref:DUF3240 family protein n=1 Tax=Hyphomicrobium sp. TaxID=82 RepID=UPI002FDDD3A9